MLHRCRALLQLKETHHRMHLQTQRELQLHQSNVNATSAKLEKEMQTLRKEHMHLSVSSTICIFLVCSPKRRGRPMSVSKFEPRAMNSRLSFSLSAI